ncbi:hypothetical protein HYT24_03450 [Candidatus Pacearchaeota archaeon]|nr:hypothetical protein [Candidatus Pacearchaeota archaeon]
MKKSGVSPMVATILLIAMMIIIILILFLWFRGLTQEAVTKFDKNAELVCGEVFFQASYENGMLGISNTGNVPIYDIKVKTATGGSYETQSMSEISTTWPQFGLAQGKAFSSQLSTSAEKIVVTPVLLGNIESGGERTYDCNEAKYGYEIST